MRKPRNLDIDLSKATVRTTRLPPPADDGPGKAGKRKKAGPRFDVLAEVADRLPRYEVVIPGWRPPTLNALFRGTFRARMRLEANCHKVVGAACKAHGVAPAIVRRKVSLSIGLGPGQREGDRDAFYKALFDSLVLCRALTTDRCSGVEIGYLEFYRAPQHRKGITTLVLEDWI